MSLLLVCVSLTCWCSARADPAPGPVDSGPALAVMRAEIAAKPSRVLISVEDALTMNEQAACEIVKVAIKETRADARLVGEIVFTALHHSPAMSAVIVECAMAISPHAVDEIRRAMERALGDKAKSSITDIADGSGKATPDDANEKERGDGENEAGSGKDTSGKGVAVQPPRPAGDDFDLSTVGVGGIYLVYPGPSWFRCDPDTPCCIGDLSPACLRP